MIDSSLPLTDIHRHLDGNIRPKPSSILAANLISLFPQPPSTRCVLMSVTSLEPDLVSFLAKLDWG